MAIRANDCRGKGRDCASASRRPGRRSKREFRRPVSRHNRFWPLLRQQYTQHSDDRLLHEVLESDEVMHDALVAIGAKRGFRRCIGSPFRGDRCRTGGAQRTARETRRHHPHNSYRARGRDDRFAGRWGLLPDYPDIKVEVVIDYGLTFSAQRQPMIGAILATASAGAASIFGEAENLRAELSKPAA